MGPTKGTREAYTESGARQEPAAQSVGKQQGHPRREIGLIKV